MVPESAYTTHNNRFEGGAGGKKRGISEKRRTVSGKTRKGGSQASDLVMSYVSDGSQKGGGKNANNATASKNSSSNNNSRQQQRLQSPDARPLLPKQQDNVNAKMTNKNAQPDGIISSVKDTLNITDSPSNNTTRKNNNNSTRQKQNDKQQDSSKQDASFWEKTKKTVGLNSNDGTTKEKKSNNVSNSSNTNTKNNSNVRKNNNNAQQKKQADPGLWEKTKQTVGLSTNNNREKKGGSKEKKKPVASKRGGSGSGCGSSSTDSQANLSDLFVNNRITNSSSLPASVPDSRQSPDFIHTHNGVLSSQPATLSPRVNDVGHFPESAPAAGQPFSMMGSPVHQTPSPGFDSLPNGHNYVYHL